MKKRLFAMMTTISIVSLALVGCGEDKVASTEAQGEGVEVLNVGISGPNSPKVAFLNEKGELTGFEVEVLKELDARLPQYEFNIQAMDFANLFVALDSNRVDFISGNLRRNAEREAKYIFTKEAYNFSPYRIAVLEENNDIQSLETAKGKKIGVAASTLQAQILEKYLEENPGAFEIKYVKGDVIGSELQSGRIDAYVSPDFSIDILVENTGINLKKVGDALVPIGGSAEEIGAHYPLSKNDEALRDELDKALKEIKEDGTLREISLEWFNQDYSEVHKQ